MFLEDLVKCLFAWFKTRQWRSVLTLAFIALCAPVVALSLTLYGVSLPKNELVIRYFSLVDDDVKAALKSSDDSEGKSSEPERHLLVPLRRILQLGSFNERVVYLVANQLAGQGRLATAVRMMREIAPSGGSGFPQAHAWLANYELATWTKTRSQAETLLNDLEVVEQRSIDISPQQVIAYVRLLVDAGRTKEALATLRTHSKQHHELTVAYAELALKLDASNDFEDAVREGRAVAQANLKAGKASINDFVLLIMLALLEEDVDRALATAQGGLRFAPKDPILLRTYSKVLMTKYLALAEDAKVPYEQRLKYLDTALKADPTNPNVMTELATAIANGKSLSPQLRAALDKSLVDGTASAVTHMIVANAKLASDDPQNAIPHLRLALRQAPNSPVLLNNLAFAILMSRPEQVDEAAELIGTGLQIPSLRPDILASMLDTQGQIRSAQGDTLGAIESYEHAVNLSHRKLVTRERLVAAYREVGMSDLAEVQLRRIAELSEEED